MKAISQYLDKNWQEITMNLNNSVNYKSVPLEPGWYLIKTDMPPANLLSVGSPAFNSKSKDIAKRLSDNISLNSTGLLITQQGNAKYVIYSGHCQNIQGRAREHFYSPKANAFNFSQYPQCHNFNWSFSYCCSVNHPLYDSANDRVRVLGEQAWRGVNGWPILCKI
jgi:hypothetical protein